MCECGHDISDHYYCKAHAPDAHCRECWCDVFVLRKDTR